jgi:hypothetical protein
MSSRYYSPQNHNNRQEDTRSEFLEQDIRQRLKHRVTNEEDRKSLIVLSISHVEIFLQAIDFGVANVGSVEEGNEV